MKELSLYDILGVLAPGAVVTVGIIALFPEAAGVLANKGLSAGEFGVVVLVSYVIGNLVAGLGNLLEKGYRKFRGRSSIDQVINGDGGSITNRERQALEERLRARQVIGREEELGKLNPHDVRCIARRMYIDLEGRKATRRIDLFNAQCGMNRGIAAGFIVLIVLVAFQFGLKFWKLEIVLAGCGAIACYRMERFSRYYSGELIRAYITASDTPKTA